MPVAALPLSTAQAIGATYTLTDIVSVIKELIDNALDASATSISVETSQNTIDFLHVKDNGSGVSPEDYPLICKHACTSKIQSLEDLREIGGKSLGFRGEALASTAEISGSLTISTRTASEVTGSQLTFGRSGELIGNQRISHTVGTSVRIADLFKCVPVRRQSALKIATKNVVRIRKLLESYAFARPSIRMSFKVVKSKSENHDWIYVSKSDATLREAALKLLGSDICIQCVYKEWPQPVEKEVSSASDGEEIGYTIKAFLPKPDADIPVINNLGSFLSIDGRPMSSTRGALKDLTKQFKTFIRASASRNGFTGNILDPFLCLHLQCPKGSYDVNVEALKDDVIFSDPALVSVLLEDFFTYIYGDIPQDDPHLSRTVETASATSNFNILLAKNPLSKSKISMLNDNSNTEKPEHLVSQKAPQQHNSKTLGRPSSRLGTEPSCTTGMTPWTMAKMQSIRPSQKSTPTLNQSVFVATPIRATSSTQQPIEMPRHNIYEPTSPSLPSPLDSEISMSPSSQRSSPTYFAPSDSLQGIYLRTRERSALKASRDRARERYGNGALDTWFQKTSQRSIGALSKDGTVSAAKTQPSPSEQAVDSIDAIELSDRAQIQKSSETLSLRPTGPEQPTQSHIRLSSRTSRETEGSEPVRRQAFPVLDHWSSQLHSHSLSQELGSGLEDALDFERRKRAAILARRTNKQNQHNHQNSPHHNRFKAARAALKDPLTLGIRTGNLIDESVPSPPSVDLSKMYPNDPRTYLIRYQTNLQGDELQNYASGPTGKRMPTGKLPLEKIPEEYDCHGMSLTLRASLQSISLNMNLLRIYDTYPLAGTNTYTLQESQIDIKEVSAAWRERLALLLHDGTEDQMLLSDLQENIL